jgi:type II secretory pathway pseudopilin PulG
MPPSPDNFPTHRLPRPRRAILAFTLVEMLVSIAIFSIISILLLVLLNQVAGSWALIQNQIDTRQNGRAILTMMANDVRGAALPVDKANVSNLQFVIDPTNFIGGTPNLLNPHAFFWQAPIATDSTYGKMAEVGYFVQWDTSISSNPKPILCRFFLNPTTRVSPANTNYGILTSPGSWINPTLATNVAPGVFNSTANNNYSGWVADNVVGLWVRGVDSAGYPITNTAFTNSVSTAVVSTSDTYAYDSRQGYTTSYTIGGHTVSKTLFKDSAPATPVYVFNCNLPAYLDITVMVIDSRAAQRISSLGTQTSLTNYASTNTAKYWTEINTFYTNQPTFIQSSARIYSTRVQLNNAY